MAIAVIGRGKISWLVEEIIGQQERLVFYDDNVKNCEKIDQASEKKIIISIGESLTRKRLFEFYKDREILSVISPSSTVSKYASLEKGVILSFNTVLHAHAHLEQGVFIYSNSVVDTYARVGEFTRIAPQCYIGERAIVGKNCFIAAGVKILPDVSIGDNCEVAAGAVVNRSFGDNEIIAGSPARSVKGKHE